MAYRAPRVFQQSTTTGTGTVTFSLTKAQHQAFYPRVLVGDPVEYFIRDANSVDWEEGEGTLASSTTMTRDSCIQSSNSDAFLNLSSGTHDIVLTFSSLSLNKLLFAGESFVDHVESGLLLPTSSGSLTGTVALGVAQVIGARIKKGAQAILFTTLSDNYVDLTNTGALVVQHVSVAAGAPAITANSIRLGYVTTGVSTITSATQTGKDSLGNWMRNTVRVPSCRLIIPYNAGISAPNGATMVSFTSASHEVMDNVGMHSITTNNTRITSTFAGEYRALGTVQFGQGGGGVSNGNIYYAQINFNGSIAEGTQCSQRANTGDFPAQPTVWGDYMAAGQYIELGGYNADASTQNIVRANIYVARVG